MNLIHLKNRVIQRRGIFPELCCLIAGSSLPFAFAPFHCWFLAPIAVAILVYAWATITPNRAMLRGWLFGIGLYGVGASWVYVSIHRFGHVSVTEHANFTLSIEGISRACSHELVRHRIASYTQQSQRYVRFTKDDLKYREDVALCIMPKAVVSNLCRSG